MCERTKMVLLNCRKPFRLISTWSVLLPIERPLFPSIGFFTYWKNRTKKCSLYEDGLCSERSRDLIEEHLSECETCRNIYKTIYEEIRVTEPISENSAEAESFTQTAQADILKNLSRKLRQDKLFAGGCMLIIGLVLAILFSWLNETMFFDSQFGTVPIVDYRIKAEDITVTELYELKNGDIYCTLDSRKPLSIITSSSEILPFRKLYSILYILRKKGYTWFIIEEMRTDHVSFMGKRI